MYFSLIRLEPIGVLTCAALMGFASFEVMKESVESLFLHNSSFQEQHWSSVWNMLLIVVTKLGLLVLCQKAGEERTVASLTSSDNYDQNIKAAETASTSVIKHDSTMEALALDHLNACLSNIVAAIALMTVLVHPSMWWVDHVGAMVVSAYIMYS
jgi:divalent metal cation (Fe/Co/Zn/Cd) transporter